MESSIPSTNHHRRRSCRPMRMSLYVSSSKAQRNLLEQLDHHEREEQLKIDLHGEGSWQVKALTFLHSPYVDWTLSGLLVLDILITFAVLYLEPEYPDCYKVMESAVCMDGEEPSCIERDEPRIISLMDVSSLSITCIFMAENIALLAALGFRNFFGNIFHAIDFIIVATSLTLEVLFLLMGEEDLANLVGLLLLARLWRLVSLGHGLVTATTNGEQKLIESLEERIKELEQLLESKGDQNPESKQIPTDEKSDGDYIAMT